MKKAVLFSLLLVIVLILCFLWSLSTGSVHISLGDAFSYLTGRQGAQDHDIVMKIRLPRILYAVLVGGMLAVSGAMLQALLKNPLVDPFITGISSGAAFGAACAIIAGMSGLIAPSMAGALLTMYIVYRLSLNYGTLNITRLLLTGVMMGSFFSSLIMMMNALFSRDIIKVVLWLMGDLSNIDGSHIAAAAVIAAVVSAAGVYFGNDLNILTTGEQEAKTLGVHVEFIKLLYFVFASVLTAVSVALSGVIGFVGLIIPHIIRYFTGPDMRVMIPCSFLAGAVFLLSADTIARTVFLPGEIPVGVITGLIGVPVFIFLMVRKKAV
jgi:iron complex transport system permease protein